MESSQVEKAVQKGKQKLPKPERFLSLQESSAAEPGSAHLHMELIQQIPSQPLAPLAPEDATNPPKPHPNIRAHREEKVPEPGISISSRMSR